MRQFLATLGVSAVLTVLVGAQGHAPRPTPAEQARLLHRNKALLRAAVETGLTHGGMPDPLDRAGTSVRLANQLADEITAAADQGEPARMVELSRHFNHVMDQGVTANLTLARKTITPGADREKVLFDRRDEAVSALAPVEGVLLGAAAEGNRDAESALKELRKGRDRIVQAAKR